MNNDELKELGETLIGISRGEPWQFFKYSSDWIEVEPGTDPIKVVFNGHKIRLKPWQLTDTINGHILPAGKEWHRDDFTKDMLPAPHRPMMMYEKGHDGMEFLDFDEQWKPSSAGGQESMPGHLHRRTTRPTPRPIPAPPVLTPEKVAEGWIEWHGGPCPVEPESVVKCRVRGVSEHSEWKAVAKAIAWEHHNSPGDVIAYKPDPYGHLRQAKAEGKTIEYGDDHGNWYPAGQFTSIPARYRVKTVEPVADAPQKLPELLLDQEVGEAAVKWWDHHVKENPALSRSAQYGIRKKCQRCGEHSVTPYCDPCRQFRKERRISRETRKNHG